MASTPYSQLNPLLDALLACAARSPAEMRQTTPRAQLSPLLNALLACAAHSPADMRQATVLPSTVDRHTLPSPSISHPSWQESYRG